MINIIFPIYCTSTTTEIFPHQIKTDHKSIITKLTIDLKIITQQDARWSGINQNTRCFIKNIWVKYNIYNHV